MNITSLKWALALFLFSVLTFHCRDRNTDSSPVVARVGDARLHFNDIVRAMPDNPNLEISSIQVQRYVQRWVESELIYQEAQRDGTADQQELQNLVREMTREVIVSAYVEQASEKAVKVTEADINAAYEANIDEFVRTEDEYLMRLILVSRGG